MTRPYYDTADALVYDPVHAHRNATRAVLSSLGFYRVRTCDTVQGFSDIIKKSPPDLAMCEAQGADLELCEAIQTLRQGEAGHVNPFLIIIVTAWEKSDTLVKRVLNSGADDLILRPFSTQLLRSRIDTHVERRKDFVVTHDYVGPDRRLDPSRSRGTEMFQPPNSLKMKAQQGLSVPEANARLERELERARGTLNCEKLRRDAFQICVLWRLLQEPEDPGEAANLARLRELTHAVVRRCRGTEYEGAIAWCDSVLAALEGLQYGVDRNASMHLLGHAALSLNQVVHPEKSRLDHMRTIEETAVAIKARAAGGSSANDPFLQVASA